MKKVCFLSWHFKTPEIFLQTLLKMTPNKSGKWRNMIAVTNPQEADYIFVFDGYSGNLPQDRVIYCGQHPQIGNGLSPSFRTYEGYKCLLALRLDKFPNLGEWWINYTYDELSAMKSPQKTKDLACIMTYQTHNKLYAQRPKFMGKFANKYKKFDLYGRPEERFRKDSNFNEVYKGSLGHNKPDGLAGEHFIGKEILKDYRYSLEFDVGKTRNYFSERFYDAILLWTIPIYFGSTNLQEFLPVNSFRYVDIYDESDSNIQNIVEIVNSDFREQNLKAIEEARDLLLNKYQTWAYAYDVINNLEKYKKCQL